MGRLFLVRELGVDLLGLWKVSAIRIGFGFKILGFPMLCHGQVQARGLWFGFSGYSDPGILIVCAGTSTGRSLGKVDGRVDFFRPSSGFRRRGLRFKNGVNKIGRYYSVSRSNLDPSLTIGLAETSWEA